MSARILVVCTGNVCRSPFLEHLLRARLDAEFGPEHGITVESRGTEALDGAPMDTRMLPFLREALSAIKAGPSYTGRPETGQLEAKDVDLEQFDEASRHEARRLTAADVASADLVVTATRAHRQAVNRLAAQGLSRTFTLRQLAVLLTKADPAALPDEPADRVAALTAAAARQRGIVVVADAEHDIVDPHGQTPELYAEAVAQLLSGLDAVVEVLARRPPRRSASSGTRGDLPLLERDARDAAYARARARRRRRRAIRKAIARSIVAAAVIVLIVGCWVGVRGVLAYQHLQQVRADATQLKTQLQSGNTSQTAVLTDRIQRNARSAHELTSDLAWALAERLPVLGGDLRAAGTVARVSDVLGQEALPPLTPLTKLLAPQPGGVEQTAAPLATAAGSTGTGRFAHAITVLGQQQAALSSAADALSSSQAALAGVDTKGLIGPEASAITQLSSQVGEASSAVAAAARASAVLPAMFDAPTPKTYLLLFQNPAEARSLGGIAGAYAVVRADHGHFSLLATGAGSAIPQFRAPVLSPEPAYGTLFQNQPTTFFLDTTQTPYFPDAARLAQRMWQLHSGTHVDGVISTDPVLLSYLLAQTGPVTVPGAGAVPGKTLTSANAAAYLMNGIYNQIADPDTQNLVFARTTAAVFAALSDGRGDSVGLLRALHRGMTEGRLDVWDPNPTVTDAIAGTSLTGIPSPGTDDLATVGVYVNDGTGSKMSWYLRRSASLSVGGVSAGFRTVTLTLTLGSAAPKTGLPAYVSGGAAYGVPVGTTRDVVYVLAPVGGSVVSAELDGRSRPLGTGELHGRIVGVTTVDVAAGARHTVTVTLLAPAGSQLPQLLLQPLAH